MNDHWEVYAVDGYGNRRCASTYILATTEAKAIVAGKEALKMLGVERVRTVRAILYRPEFDPSMRTHLRQR